MIYKLTLTLSGKRFTPDRILSSIIGNYLITDKHNPTDKIFPDEEDIYDEGSISFFNPVKFSLDDHLMKYEKWFVDFLLINYELFVRHGVEEIVLFTEIYHADEQCNFEILDKGLLRKVSHIDISFPVSTYLLRDVEFNNWVKEIDQEWKN
ncbi:MAG: hypothetical protein PHT77_12015 [Bacteroidales bacterium]|nr:hypothetical protein [Bacteroidales bacterium]